MATAMKTPGVYIKELSAFPNSVVEVETAVPAFIGYTEKADNKGKPLTNVPMRISSMVEFITYFGQQPNITFNVKPIDPKANPAPAKAFTVNKKDYAVTPTVGIDSMYLLYSSMRLFFANGGGPCYVVSVGKYGDPISADKLTAGVDLLEKEQEPTMVVIPDAMHLAKVTDCITLQQHALLHCGTVMQSRVAILDVYNGFLDKNDPAGDPVQAFRDKLGITNLDFGAAYYPWLRTTILTDDDVTYAYVDPDDLTNLLQDEAADTDPNAVKKLPADVLPEIKKLSDNYSGPLLNKTLTAKSAAFPQLITEIERQLNMLPPSGAMAGVYSRVDGSQGVWKAPANVSLLAVDEPTVKISSADQESLNVDIQGKSVNAIRSFIGEGVLVWGARTLDGNSLDWRYISVRRTMIMIEQSIKLAAKAYVFDNNVSTTWVTVKSMIRNFLNSVWKRGGLAGAIPDDAFQVFCGLGETMTGDDILEGIMRVTVLVAVTRPAEFIEITFQQQMQKS